MKAGPSQKTLSILADKLAEETMEKSRVTKYKK